jgi:hypothetical protein
MTEEEARVLMQTQGWRYKERSPRRHAKYVYAKRWERGKLLERYICPLSRLGELTEQELRAKLTLKLDSPPQDKSL